MLRASRNPGTHALGCRNPGAASVSIVECDVDTGPATMATFSPLSAGRGIASLVTPPSGAAFRGKRSRG